MMPGDYNTNIIIIFFSLQANRTTKSPTKLVFSLSFELWWTSTCSLLSKAERKSLAALKKRRKKRIFAENSCVCWNLSLRKNFFRYKIRCRLSSNIQFRFHFQRETLAWITTAHCKMKVRDTLWILIVKKQWKNREKIFSFGEKIQTEIFQEV